MYKHKESYKHLLAKEVFYQWLVAAEKGKDFCSLNPFKWRANYGVFKELPFHDTDDPYYFENSNGLVHSPTTPLLFDESKRGCILFVPDVTVFHKGTPIYLFEIVHTHHVTNEKITKIKDFFSGFYVEVYEISAEFILKQCDIPEKIVCDCIYYG